MDFQEWFQSWNWMHHPMPPRCSISPYLLAIDLLVFGKYPHISSIRIISMILVATNPYRFFHQPVFSLASNILFIVVINILRSKSKFSSNLRLAETAPGTRQPRHLATWNLPENGCVHPLTIRIASTRYGDFTWESQVEAAILSKLWKVNTFNRFII